jgi:RNA polymerase sigma-70 factor (ECF subfamily)
MATRQKEGDDPSLGECVQLSVDAALPSPRLGGDDPLPPDDRAIFPAPTSLGELYRAYAPRLLRFFLRRGQGDEASDLVQESFTRLVDAGGRSAGEIERPEAYLSRIATNLLRNRAKVALRRSLAAHIPVDDVPLCGHDPVAALEARDQLERLQDALARLSPKTRDIFLAHRLDGMTYKDIATQTGLSIKGVEWHMSKAIAHLDRLLRQRR